MLVETTLFATTLFAVAFKGAKIELILFSQAGADREEQIYLDMSRLNKVKIASDYLEMERLKKFQNGTK